MTTRVLFSVSDEVMALFRAVVPSRERSKTIETMMREEVERRVVARQQQIEALAALVESGPEFADLRAVSVDANAVAGEAVS
ncbi:MAG: hypothetical protein ACOYNF_16680 [Rhodoferax sp.]|nr:hypothetical protein [Rhodoferax sp.]